MSIRNLLNALHNYQAMYLRGEFDTRQYADDVEEALIQIIDARIEERERLKQVRIG